MMEERRGRLGPYRNPPNALRVPCPYCNVIAGTPCMTRNGRTLKAIWWEFHKARKDDWKIAQAKKALSGNKGCGDNSCRYAESRGGMRTNGGCRCDECPDCGATIRHHRKHRDWCTNTEWISAWERQRDGT